jgi:hypothetical protein
MQTVLMGGGMLVCMGDRRCLREVDADFLGEDTRRRVAQGGRAGGGLEADGDGSDA